MPRLSLRARLLLGVLLLATAGLVVADAFTYTSLRSFLLDRVDSTLEADHQGAERARPGFGPGRGGPGPFGGPGRLGSDYVQFRASNGKTIVYDSGVPYFFGTTAPAAPELPETITLPEASPGSPDRVSYFTVPAKSGDDRWRVRASLDPGAANMLVLATSLSGVDGTLHRLLVI